MKKEIKLVNVFLTSKTSIDILLIHGRRTYVEGSVESTFRVEVEKPYKIYNSKLLRQLLRGPGSVHCWSMIHWIGEHIAVGKDYLRLDRDQIRMDLDIQRATYYNTIKKLEDINFINRRGGGGRYDINPYFLFKGDRIKYFDAYGDEYLNVLNKTNPGVEAPQVIDYEEQTQALAQ